MFINNIDCIFINVTSCKQMLKIDVKLCNEIKSTPTNSKMKRNQIAHSVKNKVYMSALNRLGYHFNIISLYRPLF